MRVRSTIVLLAALTASCGRAAAPSARPSAAAPTGARPAEPVDVAALARRIEQAGAGAGGAAASATGDGGRRPSAGIEAVPALAAACVRTDLDAASRSRAVRALALAPDPRAIGCWKLAVTSYRPGVSDEELAAAAHGLLAVRARGVVPALVDALAKVPAAGATSAAARRATHEAVVALADPAAEAVLVERAGRALAGDAADAIERELLAELACVEALGRMRAAGAVDTLFAAARDPRKAPLGPTLVLALVRSGKPAAARAAALARGGEPSLGAQVLGAIGRPDAAPPILDAIGRADAPTRVLLARELGRLPKDPAVTAALQAAFERTPPDLVVGGIAGRAALMDAAADTLDPALTSWVVDAAIAAKGPAEAVVQLRAAAMLAALKIAGPRQIGDVERLARLKPAGQPAVGEPFRRDHALVRELLERCGEREACYLDELRDPAAQQLETHMRGVKAATTLAALGRASAIEPLMSALATLHDPVVAAAVLAAVDRLSPAGDEALAAALDALADAAGPTVAVGASARAAARLTAARLRARAE